MKEKFKKYKEEYYLIGHIYCPALNYRVFINSNGFKHLTRKGRVPRTPKEKYKRLSLICYIASALENGKLVEIREEYIGDCKINTFWCIEYILDNKKIRIIVRKIKNGKMHFFSIYSI